MSIIDLEYLTWHVMCAELVVVTWRSSLRAVVRELHGGRPDFPGLLASGAAAAERTEEGHSPGWGWATRSLRSLLLLEGLKKGTPIHWINHWTTEISLFVWHEEGNDILIFIDALFVWISFLVTIMHRDHSYDCLTFIPLLCLSLMLVYKKGSYIFQNLCFSWVTCFSLRKQTLLVKVTNFMLGKTLFQIKGLALIALSL